MLARIVPVVAIFEQFFAADGLVRFIMVHGPPAEVGQAQYDCPHDGGPQHQVERQVSVT
jgi:hypothetical protein